MPDITFVSTGNQWEKRFGYARIARVGDLVLVGGTVAINSDGTSHQPGDAGAQTTRCFEIIESALSQIGLDRTSILRSRVFVTDIAQAERVGLAHKAFFGYHTPCLTQVGVATLIAPEFVVEIECDAHA
ncbi:MAG: RidA family protein [Planctomycetota bacterium]|nr:MAG: RidA family protein [Planctomycetota bacterium]